jgi:hypothetical protein
LGKKSSKTQENEFLVMISSPIPRLRSIYTMATSGLLRLLSLTNKNFAHVQRGTSVKCKESSNDKLGALAALPAGEAR